MSRTASNYFGRLNARGLRTVISLVHMRTHRIPPDLPKIVVRMNWNIDVLRSTPKSASVGCVNILTVNLKMGRVYKNVQQSLAAVPPLAALEAAGRGCALTVRSWPNADIRMPLLCF